MSGAFGQSRSSGTWCRIANGKIVRTVTEDTPGAIKVEKKRDGQGTGEYRYELHDDYVEGHIVGLERRENNWNGEVVHSLVVKMLHKPSGTLVNLQVNEGGRNWRSIMVRLPKLDLTQSVRMAPYSFTPEGETKERIGVTLYQNGDKMLPAFTRDDPGGLPDVQVVRFQGKDRYDFTDQNEWLVEHVLGQAKEKLAAMGPAVTEQPVEEVAEGDPAVSVADEPDDLPF